MIDCVRLASIAKVNLGATDADIINISFQLSRKLPTQYIDFLNCSNGIQVSGNVDLLLYSTEEIVERNLTYEISIYLPDMLLIGDDGGGQGIFLNFDDNHREVYLMGLGATFIQDAAILASSLEQWLDGKWWLGASNQSIKYTNVYLIKPPTDLKSGILRLKEDLQLSISSAMLLEAARNTPAKLLSSVPFTKYAILCQKYNDYDPCLALSDEDDPELNLEH